MVGGGVKGTPSHYRGPGFEQDYMLFCRSEGRIACVRGWEFDKPRQSIPKQTTPFFFRIYN